MVEVVPFRWVGTGVFKVEVGALAARKLELWRELLGLAVAVVLMLTVGLDLDECGDVLSPSRSCSARSRASVAGEGRRDIALPRCSDARSLDSVDSVDLVSKIGKGVPTGVMGVGEMICVTGETIDGAVTTAARGTRG